MAALAVLLASAPAAAAAYCVEPTKPFCATAFGDRSPSEAARCITALKRFLTAYEAYTKCRIDDAQQDLRDTAYSVDSDIDRMECEAAGKDFCF